MIGRPTIFVRTGGCDYRCSWCDTMYAVLPEHRDTWKQMQPWEILEEVSRLSGGKPILVTLSGGNPALQPLQRVIKPGQERGYTFALETQGSLARDWFTYLDYLTLSPKPPSSGMRTNWQKLEDCLTAAGEKTVTVFKVVIFDDDDYLYAREVWGRFPHVQMYLQVGNPAPLALEPDIPGLLKRLEWISSRVTADGWHEVAVLPQLHVLMWGNRRGV